MKKLLIILSFIFIITGAAGIISACDGNEQNVVPQDETPSEQTPAYTELAAPTNLQWDKESWTLSWDAVEGAESYVIFATDSADFYYSAENYCNLEYKLTTNSTVTIMVHSVSKNDYSDWSEEITVKTETSSSMLVYTLMEDGQGYEVDRRYSDINYGLEGRVVIADYYNGLPVKSIAENAFKVKGIISSFNTETGENCNTVTTSFHLPKYLESIGVGAFALCILIEELNLPEGVSSIGNGAFFSCINLKVVNNFPETITEIADSLFNSTAIESFTFSENVVSIGVTSFAYCDNLTEIVIPDNVKEIGFQAFNGCVNLKSVTISESENIVSFGMDVFVDTAWINSQTDDYVMLGSILYMYQGEETVINSLPSEIKAIAGAAFYQNTTLTYINLSDVKLLGSNIFRSCTALEGVSFEIDTIPGHTFDDCENLKTVEGIENVVSFGSSAFSGCKLTDITFSEELTTIGDNAFSGCSLITEIVIPENTTSIGLCAFQHCDALKKVIIYGNVDSIGNSAFGYCASLTTVEIYGETGTIGKSAFLRCTALESIIIPESVTTINDDAFYYCTSLAAVYYAGSASDWSRIETGEDNDGLSSATIYCYALNDGATTAEGNYWYYDNDGNIKTWSIL